MGRGGPASDPHGKSGWSSCWPVAAASPSPAGARDRLARTLVRQLAGLSDAQVTQPDPTRLELLVKLEGRSADELADVVLPRFVDARRDRLAGLYSAYRDDDRASPLLYAADALLIFELLERDPDRLHYAWAERFPVDELEALASTYGVAI